MESNYPPQTNLATILQTLQAYAPSQQQTLHAASHFHAPQANHQPQAPPQAPDLEEGEYDPSAYDPTLPLVTKSNPQALNPQTHPPPPTTTQPHPTQPPPPPSHPPAKTPSTPPTQHPATITTWPPALRHVTGQSASNADFTRRIRHLITTQHQHERQWWSGRASLQNSLANREAGRKKLDDVLGALGGHVGASSTTDELSAEQELKMYDRKVHRACEEMAAATVKELRKLGVPFFCIVDGSVTEEGGGKAQGQKKGTISEQDLMALKGRMMVLLEDLCGEE